MAGRVGARALRAAAAEAAKLLTEAKAAEDAADTLETPPSGKGQ